MNNAYARPSQISSSAQAMALVLETAQAITPTGLLAHPQFFSGSAPARCGGGWPAHPGGNRADPLLQARARWLALARSHPDGPWRPPALRGLFGLQRGVCAAGPDGASAGRQPPGPGHHQHRHQPAAGCGAGGHSARRPPAPASGRQPCGHEHAQRHAQRAQGGPARALGARLGRNAIAGGWPAAARRAGRHRLAAIHPRPGHGRRQWRRGQPVVAAGGQRFARHPPATQRRRVAGRQRASVGDQAPHAFDRARAHPRA